MSFFDLPIELLLSVADQLPVSDLNHFCQTSRCLYPVISRYLYRHNIIHFGGFALLWAAMRGFDTIVQLMLCIGASPNIRFDYENPGKAGEIIVSRFWCEEPGDGPNEYSKPRYGFLKNNILPIPRVIRNHIPRHFKFRSPLQLACAEGYTEVVHTLLEQSDTIRETIDGFSSLITAAMYGRPGVVEYLLAHGSYQRPDKPDSFAPLMMACLYAFRPQCRKGPPYHALDAGIETEKQNRHQTAVGAQR